MSKTSINIVASAALFCGFLLLPSTSQAGGNLGYDVDFTWINTGEGSDAPICDTVTTCQYPDPMFGDLQQPAVAFDLDSDRTVHLEADIFNGFGCGDFQGTAAGDLDLPAGHDVVFLRFNPPLDPYTEISMVWRVGPTCSTACSNYCIDYDPPICQ